MISGPMAVVFICNGVPYFVYLQNSDSTVGSRRRLPCVGESSNSSLVIGHDDSSVTLTDDVQDESCEEGLILTSSKRCRMALASDESDSDVTEGIEQNSESKDMQCKSKYVLEDMPKAVYKTEQDAIPLPDPFELPKHYRPDVEVALKSGKMTVDTNKSFLSTVAAAMFTYKRYPTADDYNNVARVIIHQYPFMKSPTGKPHVSCSFGGSYSFSIIVTVLYRGLLSMD